METHDHKLTLLVVFEKFSYRINFTGMDEIFEIVSHMPIRCDNHTVTYMSTSKNIKFNQTFELVQKKIFYS